MRTALLIFALLSVMAGTLACSNQNGEWKEAQEAGERFWSLMREGQFANAHGMLHPTSNQAGKRTAMEFVDAEKELTNAVPDLYKCKVQFSPRYQASQAQRAGIYEFDLNLQWPGGNPLLPLQKSDEANLTRAQRYILNTYGEAMFMSLQKYQGVWKVHVIKPSGKIIAP